MSDSRRFGQWEIVIRILPIHNRDVEKGSIYVLTLAKAAEIVGGIPALRDALGVRQMHLDAWLSGRSSPPAAVFLKAVDLIESATASDESLPGPDSSRILDLLHAAIQRSGADFGNVQMLQGSTLYIVGQQGFETPFLDYFARVEGPDCACGAAMASHARFCVEDVASHPMFVGTTAGAVLAQAGVRAVQSTPIFGREGRLLGMLSTHYKSPHAFAAAELDIVDEMAAAAGSALGVANAAT
jgi:GAF domain-containing protein